MDGLVHPKEKLYFTIALLFSLVVYSALLLAVGAMPHLLIYVLIVAFAGHVAQGIFVGSVLGDGVRVTEKQFPEVYRLVGELAEQMGLRSQPAVYVIQGGGLLNAFATHFASRSFVVVYSDMLELAYERGEAALKFVLAHELAHIRRGHVSNMRWLILPGMILPMLGSAYRRACEYTCDRFGAYFAPEGATQGLLVLAAGSKLYRRIDVREYESQARQERSVWTWLAELLQTHPLLMNRISAVSEAVQSAKYEQTTEQPPLQMNV